MNDTYRVLVVEDELPLQHAIVKKLEVHNMDAIPVRTVQDALSAIKTDPSLHAVWLDHYLLGSENGIDLVRALKELGREGEPIDIPIFVVSNTASDAKIKEYMLLGVTEYFVKASNKLDQIIEDIQQQLYTAESA
jgi:CheY-like chemotaxis protein